MANPEIDPENGVTVVLDTTLTDALSEEGMVREVVSKVQSMRKEADFKVMDHILLSVSGNKRIEAIVAKNAEEIASDVLATKVVCGEEPVEGAKAQTWDINGEKATIAVMVIEE